MFEDSSIERVASAVRRQAESMRPGERLPSSRELISRLGVSPVTLSRALAGLAAEGVLVTRPGSGTFVADVVRGGPEPEDMSWQTLALADHTIDAKPVARGLALPQPGQISLAGGYAHSFLLPTRALAAAVARAARRPDSSERPPTTGIAPLRAWFAGPIPNAGADDVLITSGGQSALASAFRAIVPSGEPILVESPTYIGAIAIARAAGLRVIPVPTDNEGVQPDALEAAFATTGARLFYLQPTFQNPLGAVLGAERRRRVLDAAARAGAFVVEDDYARWLPHCRSVPPPLLADDSDGRVVTISSLTKAVSPNLRVGAVISRGPVAERIRAHRLVDDFFVSRTLQEAALELLSSPAWRTHQTRLAVSLTERKAALLAALGEYTPELRVNAIPGGGFHLWIRLPDGTDDVQVADEARVEGVLINPGRPFFASEPPAPYIRLSFAAAPELRDLREGVRRLARSLAKSSGSRP
jgi:DNA-binding transcriptional MocR family regulator